jgi:dipeptidyl aminopeptidase/acylaminoacyl peptidase
MAKSRDGRVIAWLVCILGTTLSLQALAAPPLHVYGKLPGFEMASLSDSGERIALIAIVKEERRLIVLDNNAKPILVAPLGDTKARSLHWAGDDYVLVYKSDTRAISPLDFTAPKAELFSMIVVPLNGQKVWSVFANRSTITGGVTGFYGVRQRDGKYFGYFGGITLDGGTYTAKYLQSTDPVLYEVDLQNQSTDKIAPRLEGDGYRRWIVGPEGKVTATLDFRSKGGDWTIRNRDGDKIAFGKEPLGGISLVGLGATPDTLVYGVDDEEDGDQWYEVPLSGGEAKPFLLDVALRNVIFDSRSRQIAGYVRHGDTPAYKFFGERQQKVIDGTLKAFPGLSVHLVDWNHGFDKLIVMTEGAGDPQTWWLVDIKTGRATDLGVSYPISSKDVAPMRMIEYAASDGLTIPAVLTLPTNAPAKNLPVIVLPHGGPHVRDYPGFDWWAQAFASRGYAVLQPNFRGSTGYSTAFERAGYGEWGRKMQSDLSDGLAHLVKEGIIDPQRACIVGASYGGYAALAGVTLQQGIYRCAVSVNGVSDLQEMVTTEIRESGSNATLRRALKRQIGSGKDLRAVSPINLAASADAPVLLIHGKDDIVVRYSQSAAMEKALRKADKPVQLITLDGEDHWLSKSATRLAMLEAAIAFVEQHNPPARKE